MRKISSPPGFDPGTVQNVASRNTDWAIPAGGGPQKCKVDDLHVVTELGQWKNNREYFHGPESVLRS